MNASRLVTLLALRPFDIVREEEPEPKYIFVCSIEARKSYWKERLATDYWKDYGYSIRETSLVDLEEMSEDNALFDGDACILATEDIGEGI